MAEMIIAATIPIKSSLWILLVDRIKALRHMLLFQRTYNDQMIQSLYTQAIHQNSLQNSKDEDLSEQN